MTEPRIVDDEAVKASLRAMLEQGATFAKALWYQRAQDLVPRGSGSYLQGIADAEIRLISEQISGTSIETVYRITNTSPHASIVENGHAAFHLPDHIKWSGPNVKHGKKGPYLHIPFRHAAYQGAAQREASGMTLGTLRTMLPETIYAQAKRLRFTRKTNAGRQLTSSGQFRAQDVYTRLGEQMNGPGFVGGAGGTVDAWRSSRTVQGRSRTGQRLTNPAWGSSRFAGLFKTGGTGHASYMTIRTVTPRSAGFNIPAHAGYGVARQVAAALSGSGAGAAQFRDMLVSAARAALAGA